MDKITFLNELEYQLHRLPNHVVDEVMNEYENHFYREGLDGKSDEAIVNALDTPKQIAKQHYAKYAVKNAEKKPDVTHLVRAVFATIGMSMITLFFIVIPLFFCGLTSTHRDISRFRHVVIAIVTVDYRCLVRDVFFFPQQLLV